MSWIVRLLHCDRDTHDTGWLEALDERVASAQQQRVEAAEIRADAEKYGPALRRHVQRNHFTEGFAQAFYGNDRRERHA